LYDRIVVDMMTRTAPAPVEHEFRGQHIAPRRETDMVRIAIVDDHPIARRGVAGALAEAGDFEVVASVDVADALGPVLADAGLMPEVVILDLYHDGDEPCLGAVEALSARTRVLVMSASGRPADVLGAVRAGAGGYITKQAQPALFATAVRTVAAGAFWLSSQLADLLQLHLTGSARPDPAARLSPREEQALDLVARGFTHAQTATRMGVSKSTVDTYVERIRGKLQVGNKAELTRAAMLRSGRG
jgi:two-component system, NarL family, nitrate/nitrite response regulator NarL